MSMELMFFKFNNKKFLPIINPKGDPIATPSTCLYIKCK